MTKPQWDVGFRNQVVNEEGDSFLLPVSSFQGWWNKIWCFIPNYPLKGLNKFGEPLSVQLILSSFNNILCFSKMLGHEARTEAEIQRNSHKFWFEYRKKGTVHGQSQLYTKILQAKRCRIQLSGSPIINSHINSKKHSGFAAWGVGVAPLLSGGRFKQHPLALNARSTLAQEAAKLTAVEPARLWKVPSRFYSLWRGKLPNWTEYSSRNSSLHPYEFEGVCCEGFNDPQKSERTFLYVLVSFSVGVKAWSKQFWHAMFGAGNASSVAERSGWDWTHVN